MLAELAAVESGLASLECPFPTNLSTSLRSIDRRKEPSSACHTEYDNAESEGGVCSDSEINNVVLPKKNGLRRGGGHPRRRRMPFFHARSTSGTGDDADVDSLCSSLGSSIYDPAIGAWKSAHSIGYDDEYELAVDSGPAERQAAVYDEMEALSRDIRRNFGEFQLATFSDHEIDV
jgi:hypothetical protein